MPYLIVDNFSGGLDGRRHVLNSRDGTLAQLKNAHITRGGEIEKRKAFVGLATLPEGTFGLEANLDNVYVFGSAAAPSMPAGITYQRLQHPDGLAMTKVVWSTVYGGLPFVIAEYSNGDRLCFWDGAIIRDWHVGIATAAMGSLANFAEHLRQDFSLAGYTCTRSGSTLSISGAIGKTFDVSASASLPVTVAVNKVQSASDAIDGKVASGSFTVTAGSEKPSAIIADLRFINGNSLPDITGIYVNGVEILNLSPGSGVRWDTISHPSWGDMGPRFVYTLWTVINANSANSGYTAEYRAVQQSGTDRGDIAILADSALGSEPNGYEVEVEFASDPSYVYYVQELANTFVPSPYNAGRTVGKFSGDNNGWNGFGGSAGSQLALGEYNGITSIKVDGIEIMGSTVPWKSSNSETAVEIANAINAHTSTPEYTVDNENGEVIITALTGTGALANGKIISVTTQGNVVVSGTTALSGGTNGFPGASQVTTVALGGTFQVGARASVTITDTELDSPYIFGASRVSGQHPSFGMTYKGKEYVAVGSTMYFSALNDATKWDIYDIGSGFIDMSNNFGGRESLTGFGVYQNKLAVFSRRNVQLWFLSPDPAQNNQDHVLANTGAIAPDSVASMGSIDVMYLSDSGIRSLRARENTDTAFASDIGSPIDNIVVEKLSTMTEEQKYSAKGIVEPNDGRYWLSIGDVIYVLSYFPGSNISGWSVYEPGFTVDEIVTQSNIVYLRSGSDIYIYGGANGDQYDQCQVVIEMPYLDAKKPATYKGLRGIDATLSGLWEISIGFDHTNPNARDVIARIDAPTFALGKVDAVGSGTHFGVKMVNEDSGYAKVACLIVHYDDMHSKHDAG